MDRERALCLWACGKGCFLVGVGEVLSLWSLGNQGKREGLESKDHTMRGRPLPGPTTLP